MTATEKILAVQTLFDELITTKYNGSVAVDCSKASVLSPSSAQMSVAEAPTNPSQPFAVELQFILNSLVTDGYRPSDRPLVALMCSYSAASSFGYDFSQKGAYYGIGDATRGNPNIQRSTAYPFDTGKIHTIKFSVDGSNSLSVSIDGTSVLSADGTPPLLISPNTYRLVFKGVNASVLSTKIYYKTGVLVSSQKGVFSLNAPYWTTQGEVFTQSTEEIVVKTMQPASAELVALYLDMAAQKMLARLYPFDSSKTVLDIPPKFDLTQVELAVRLYARAGAEGEIGHNENGINRTYKTVDDEDILSRLVPFCGVW